MKTDLHLRAEEREEVPMQKEDDTLRLVFTCCHPALSREAQVALTLRTLAGLTTEEVARAFLVPVATMAQRLVRAKKKIAGARIPYRVPEASERPERLAAVLRVIYLVFNEGYAATSGANQVRDALCDEAIRLATLLCDAAPDAEAHGLLALMALHHARRATRVDANGAIVLLEDQDRSQWDHAAIETARQDLVATLTRGQAGPYQLQACVAAIHATSANFADTDWRQIVALYGALMARQPSPIIAMNRAVAIAFAHGPDAGLQQLDPLATALDGLHLFHAARAELLRRLHRMEEAAEAYTKALARVTNEPERAFLERRLKEVA